MIRFPDTQVEINLGNLFHNLESFRSHLPERVAVGAVVKSEAYGHGLSTIVQALKDQVPVVFVYDTQELVQARSHFHKSVMVLGPVPPQDLATALAHEPILSLSRPAQLKYFEEISRTTNRKAQVHLAVDALFGREGITANELSAIIEGLRKSQHVELKGAYCHLSSADTDHDLEISNKQIAQFTSIVNELRTSGFRELKIHHSATSGALRYGQKLPSCDWVRIGIGLYGMWPSAELQKTLPTGFTRPVLNWETHLAETKLLPVGHPVGYGQTFITQTATRVGLIPVGYAFGIPRILSNRGGEVLIDGKRIPIIGRVSMNSVMVDLTKVPNTKAGAPVTLIGQQQTERITAEEIAEICSTNPYEITTRIASTVPRTVRSRIVSVEPRT